MQFLVIAERKAEVSDPVADLSAVEETIQYLKEHRGKELLAGGFFSGRRGCGLILDVPSSDQMDAFVKAMPLFAFFTHLEAIPLSSEEHTLQRARAAQERIQRSR